MHIASEDRRHRCDSTVSYQPVYACKKDYFIVHPKASWDGLIYHTCQYVGRQRLPSGFVSTQ